MENIFGFLLRLVSLAKAQLRAFTVRPFFQQRPSYLGMKIERIICTSEPIRIQILLMWRRDFGIHTDIDNPNPNIFFGNENILLISRSYIEWIQRLETFPGLCPLGTQPTRF